MNLYNEWETQWQLKKKSAIEIVNNMSAPGYLRTLSENRNAPIAIIDETIENGPIIMNEYASIRCSVIWDLIFI